MDKPRSQQCLSLSDVVGVVRPWHGEGSETRRACRTPATAARTRTRAAKRASTRTERGGDGPTCGRTRQGHASRPKTLRARKAPTSTSRPKTPTGRIAPTMACASAEPRTLAARSMAWRSSGAAASKACTPRGPTGRSLSGGDACAEIQRPMSGARCGKAAAPISIRGVAGGAGRRVDAPARACQARAGLPRSCGASGAWRAKSSAALTSACGLFPSHLGGTFT